MATVSFLLQQPYKKSENPDSEQAKLENLQLRERVSLLKREKKPLTSCLNPRETRIYLWLIENHDNVLKIKSEFTILPKDWDFANQRARKSMTGSTEFNERLSDLRYNVLKYYTRIQNEKPGISFKDIGTNIKSYVTEKYIPILSSEGTAFWNVFDQFLKAESETKTYRTIQKFKTLQTSLQEFTAIHYPNSFSFKDVDLTFYDRYTAYLRNLPPRGRQKNRPEAAQVGLLDNTIEKYISSLKSFMYWAAKRGVHTNMIFQDRDFKATRKREQNIITLTPEELKAFYHFDFSDNTTLERVRDLFCFATFTGQRWSDVERFDREQIDGDIWKFKSFKSKKEITIFFVGFASPALDILKKYNFELPTISNQKFNDYMKEAARVAGIITPEKLIRSSGSREIVTEKPKCDLISSHTARRTCVSILLNNEYLPVTLVKQITGHTKLETLQKYIREDKDALRKALERTNSYK